MIHIWTHVIFLFNTKKLIHQSFHLRNTLTKCIATIILNNGISRRAEIKKCIEKITKNDNICSLHSGTNTSVKSVFAFACQVAGSNDVWSVNFYWPSTYRILYIDLLSIGDVSHMLIFTYICYPCICIDIPPHASVQSIILNSSSTIYLIMKNAYNLMFSIVRSYAFVVHCTWPNMRR